MSLVFTSCTEPGYRRKERGDGFVYVGLKGRLLRGASLIDRIENLAIPPAWHDVWISANPRGHLQATGIDSRGRKQYIYHEKWTAFRDETKFTGLDTFAKVLPKIRATVARDLRRKRLDRRKVLALVVCLLERTLFRVGNTEYAEDNHSYGLTTLLDRHALKKGGSILFRFTGKGGKRRELKITDKRLAGLVKQSQDLPGQMLFQYKDENGDVHPIYSDDVNAYLQEISGESVTAKYYRTWGATVAAATLLAERGPGENLRDIKKNLTEAIKEVARRLGNTPAVTRRSYIHPVIIDSYASGTLVAAMKRKRTSRPKGLRADEVAVAAILRAPRT